MSRIEPVLARLDGMCWRLDSGANPEISELDALARVAEELAEQVDVAERRRLLAAVVRVREALGRSSLHVMARMEALAAGRRAATAYARGGG